MLFLAQSLCCGDDLACELDFVESLHFPVCVEHLAIDDRQDDIATGRGERQCGLRFNDRLVSGT